MAQRRIELRTHPRQGRILPLDYWANTDIFSKTKAFLNPPTSLSLSLYSSVAEHLFCKQGVGGSNPSRGFFLSFDFGLQYLLSK